MPKYCFYLILVGEYIFDMSSTTILRSDTNFNVRAIPHPQKVPVAAGLLPNGEVPTPVFMPVGTQATVKGTLPIDLKKVVQALLS